MSGHERRRQRPAQMLRWLCWLLAVSVLSFRVGGLFFCSAGSRRAAVGRQSVGLRAGPALARLPEEVDDETLKKLLPPMDIEKYGGPKEKVARQRLANGMAYEYLAAGKPDGLIPGPESEVDILFTGWRVKDGELLDSTYLRGGKPERFSMSDMMIGWKVGLKEMREGEKRRMWIPEYFGPRGDAGDVVYEIELIKVTDGVPWSFFVFLLFMVLGVQVYLKINGGRLSEMMGG